VVLVGGLVAIYFAFAPRPVSASISSESHSHAWNASVVGKKLLLPAEDAQGYRQAKDRSMLVLVDACSQCSDWLANTVAAARKPLAVLTTAKLDFVPQYLKGRSDEVLVYSDPSARLLPKDVYDSAPQMYFVSVDGLIVDSPNKGETSDAFVKRMEQK
jgi:hypothetical protein